MPTRNSSSSLEQHRWGTWHYPHSSKSAANIDASVYGQREGESSASVLRIPLLFATILTAASLHWTIVAQAADLSVAMPAEQSEAEPAVTRTTLSNYLALELTRITFDVLAVDEHENRVERKLVAWAGRALGAEEWAEIGRQLLAEGSYYLTR